MSGWPSCASTEPSRNATRLCTIDSGCTRISIRSCAEAEQVVGLDQLEALVHHRRRIDRDLGAHGPVRVSDRLARRDGRHLGARAAAERPAGRGQDQPLDALGGLAAQRLEDRVVLGIDRQQHGAAARDLGHQQRAGADQAFLGGERDHRAAAHRGERRAEAGRADDRRHHPVGRPRGGLDQALVAGRDLDAAARERLLEVAIARRVGDRGEARAVTDRRRGETRRRCGARSAPRPGSARACGRSGRACSGRPSRWRRAR